MPLDAHVPHAFQLHFNSHPGSMAYSHDSSIYMEPYTFNPLLPIWWHPICLVFLKDVYHQERTEGGSSPQPQADLFIPIEYSSAPGILGSIPIDEYHIDFHYQEDRMTFLKVCVCVWLDSMHHCFHVTEFQGHLLSLLYPCKLTPFLTLNSTSES